MRLHYKTAIVTGAGKGIGRAIAERFAAEGAFVVLATRSEGPGKETEQLIRDSGGEATFIQTDIADLSSIDRTVEQTLRLYGKIDILVNNAGITVFKPLLEVTEDDWNAVINIDLRGTLFFSKAVIPHMQRNGGGSIVNISSVHAHATLKHTEMYAAAKGGINAMTRSMALSFAADQIRINALCPGFTNTPAYQQWLDDTGRDQTEQWVHSFHPMGRIVGSEEVAALALFLCSDENKSITGSCQYIDGGLTAGLYNE